jgi:hypothetical protein
VGDVRWREIFVCNVTSRPIGGNSSRAHPKKKKSLMKSEIFNLVQFIVDSVFANGGKN